jgi:hypothetical protein
MRPARRLTATLAATALATASFIVATTASADAATCSQSYLPLPEPPLHPWRLQPRRHAVHDRLDDLRVRLDRKVRPPTSYTNALKTQGIIDYGYADKSLSSYEEDHDIPLELGGSPRDPRQPVARAVLRHQDRHHQGRRGDQAEERRLQGHHHLVRGPHRHQEQLDHRAQRHRHRLTHPPRGPSPASGVQAFPG